MGHPRIDPKLAWCHLRVARSEIHRWGVLALEDIRKGQRVIEYSGKRLTIDLAARIRFPKDRYLVNFKPGWAIDRRWKRRPSHQSRLRSEPYRRRCNRGLLRRSN